jgi:Ca-activated chloride channel family protein
LVSFYNMSFGAPEWFWGLLVIPVLIALFVRAEKRGAERLREFVSPRLLPQLAGTVDRFRRTTRFGFQLLGLACAIVALAQPRWGYTFQDVQRKGLDLLIAVDTSRSMLSNDVQPNRLERVKLAAQDLINESQGDRIGLIAFAGRAFVQAPLTADYDAVVESINNLDTKTIPEGGTNISEAITLATQTLGKSANSNRALILFTDGEELSGDALKATKSAAEAGVRIFTIGVGTPQGSLIPVTDDDGNTSFVKDLKGQVVKSKLDEKRLREIGQATGGAYFHLETGPGTMRELFTEGLSKMKAAEMDVRLSRRPIERYEWPLGVALFTLALSILLGERRRVRRYLPLPQATRIAVRAAALVLLILGSLAKGAVPGIDLYQAGKFPEAYRSFEEDLQNHPESAARDKMQFDAGTAAYKMRDYNKALESFSDALLSSDHGLQERSHYNIGRTLEERADMDKGDEETLKDLEDAKSHYEEALKLNPDNEAAKQNLEEVKKKIERLKKKPKPTPPPRSQQQKKDNNQQNSDEKNKQNQSSQQNQQNQQQQQNDQQQQSQSQDQNQSAANQQSNKQQEQSQSLAKNEPQKNQQNQPQPQAGGSPSPAPSQGEEKKQNQQSPGERQPNGSPSPSPGGERSPSPSSGEGDDKDRTPGATPSGTPPRKLAGEIKDASDESKKPPEQNQQLAEAESGDEDQMTAKQAEDLLRSTKDEEAHVQLDEHKAARHVYKDW